LAGRLLKSPPRAGNIRSDGEYAAFAPRPQPRAGCATRGTSMPNRRDFMRSSLALSALSLPPVAGVAAQASATGAAPALPLERFVVDERLPGAVMLGRAAARLGIEVTRTSGDL